MSAIAYFATPFAMQSRAKTAPASQERDHRPKERLLGASMGSLFQW